MPLKSIICFPTTNLCSNSYVNNIIFGNIRGLYFMGDKTKPPILMDIAKIKNCFLIGLVKTYHSSKILHVELMREGWEIY